MTDVTVDVVAYVLSLAEKLSLLSQNYARRATCGHFEEVFTVVRLVKFDPVFLLRVCLIPSFGQRVWLTHSETFFVLAYKEGVAKSAADSLDHQLFLRCLLLVIATFVGAGVVFISIMIHLGAR